MWSLLILIAGLPNLLTAFRRRLKDSRLTKINMQMLKGFRQRSERRIEITPDLLKLYDHTKLQVLRKQSNYMIANNGLLVFNPKNTSISQISTIPDMIL
jgi:hypothetical protein